MKSLKDELLNLDEGTAEYNATLQKAAGIQHIKRTNGRS